MAAKKTEGAGGRVTRGDIYLDPGSLFASQIKEQQKVKTLEVKRLSDAKLRDIFRERIGKTVTAAPVMELTARHPFDANGLVDMYQPGRWDTSSDQVFMDPIVQGASIGEWTGSVAYVTFKAPSTGQHLIAANFYGWQITMRLSVGGATAFSSENAPAVVTALFNATAGGSFGFSMSCTGIYLGFLQSIQIYKM